MEIGLVVPVMKNFQGFAKLIRSVDRAITPIIVDNWNKNIGVSKGWNQGIERGMDKDVLVIANDDVQFLPGTLDKLVESTQEVDLVSVVASDTCESGLWFGVFPDFCCYAIKPAEFVANFGWFDENFSPAYFEDNDMCYRMKLAGGKAAMRLDAQVIHEGSVTQFWDGHDQGVVSHAMFEANRAYYIQKWGGQPNEEKFTHPFNNQDASINAWDKTEVDYHEEEF